MVGVWEGLNLGSIPNFFLCFGMHPKIIDVYPKLIPKGGVVQFCPVLFARKDPFCFAIGLTSADSFGQAGGLGKTDQ